MPMTIPTDWQPTGDPVEPRCSCARCPIDPDHLSKSDRWLCDSCCPECPNPTAPCGPCHGTGTMPAHSLPGEPPADVPCWRCHGSGLLSDAPPPGGLECSCGLSFTSCHTASDADHAYRHHTATIENVRAHVLRPVWKEQR